MSEKITTEEIKNLEKILEQYVTKENIQKRKEIAYKSHYECKDEKWLKEFLVDYTIDLYRQIRQEECIKHKLYKV